jgi:surfactin synthase thioesterase subunit
VCWTKPQATPHARLFCFPHAGSGPAPYRAWTEAFGEGVEVWGLQLPGHGARLHEVPFGSLAALAADVATSLHQLCDAPFAFFGHSFGALLSFEAARELRRRGAAQPRALFVAARFAPRLRGRVPQVTHLDDDAFVLAVQARYGGIPAEILREPEVLEMLVPALRADFGALERYCYESEAPLAFPIVAYGGVDDETVAPDELDAWGEETENGFRRRLVPGGHFFAESVPPGLPEALLHALGRECTRTVENVSG